MEEEEMQVDENVYEDTYKSFSAKDLADIFNRLQPPEVYDDPETGEKRQLRQTETAFVDGIEEKGTVFYSRCSDALLNPKYWNEFFGDVEGFIENEETGDATTLTQSLQKTDRPIPAKPFRAAQLLVDEYISEDATPQQRREVADQLTALANTTPATTKKGKGKKGGGQGGGGGGKSKKGGGRKSKKNIEDIPEELQDANIEEEEEATVIGGDGTFVPESTSSQVPVAPRTAPSQPTPSQPTPSQPTPSPNQGQPFYSPSLQQSYEGQTSGGEGEQAISEEQQEAENLANLGIPSALPRIQTTAAMASTSKPQPQPEQEEEEELSPQEQEGILDAVEDAREIQSDFANLDAPVQKAALSIVKDDLRRRLLQGVVSPIEYVVLRAKDKKLRRDRAAEYRRNRKVTATKQQWDAMKSEVVDTIDIAVAEQMIDMADLAINEGIVVEERSVDFLNLVAQTENKITNNIYSSLAYLIAEPENITPLNKERRVPGEEYTVPSPIVNVEQREVDEQPPVEIDIESVENIGNGYNQFLNSKGVANPDMPPGAAIHPETEQPQWIHPKGFAGSNWEVARYEENHRDPNEPDIKVYPPEPWSESTVQSLYKIIMQRALNKTQGLENFAEDGIYDLYETITGRYADRVAKDVIVDGFTYGISVSFNNQDEIKNIPPQPFLQSMMKGILDSAGIEILRVLDNEPFQDWMNSEYAQNLLKGDGLQNRAYVLCGALNRQDDSLSIQLVVSREVALNLLNVEQANSYGRKTYLAVDTNSGELLGFLVTRDYSQSPRMWKEQKLKPHYFRLNTRQDAADEQGMPDFPHFYGEPGSGGDLTDDAIEGVDTKEENTNGTPNKLLFSLEMEYLCAKSQAFIETENGNRVDVNIMGRFKEGNQDLYDVFTSAGERLTVPYTDVKFYPGSRQNIGFVLMLNALIDDVDKGYWGSLIFVVNVFNDLAPLVDPESKLQQGGKNAGKMVGYADADVASKYHSWFQYERTFDTKEMSNSLGLLWFYEKGNIYQLEPSKTKKGNKTIWGRNGPSSLFPDHSIMYRPYPSLVDLASYVGQAANMFIPR